MRRNQNQQSRVNEKIKLNIPAVFTAVKILGNEL